MIRLITGMVLLVVWALPSFADEVKLEGGGTSIAAIFLPLKDRYQKLYGHTLTINQTSAVKGLIALHEGRVDLATGAHPLEDLVSGAAKAGVKVDTTDLVVTTLEENELVVIVNKTNTVKTLTKDQLKGIFTGTITNWAEIGGSNLPIDVVWGKDTVGQNIQFDRVMLDGAPVTKNIHEASNYRDITTKVRESPGAIGVIPKKMSSALTRLISAPIMKSHMYAITRGKPDKKIQQLFDFYRAEYSLHD